MENLIFHCRVFKKQPSECSHESLENGYGEEIYKRDLNHRLEHLSEINLSIKKLLEEYITRFEDMVYLVHIFNSKDRFSKFFKRYTTFYIISIPKDVLASMQSIIVETFIRILRNLKNMFI